MSNSFTLSTVLETLEAIWNMFDDVKNDEGPVDFEMGSELKKTHCYNHTFYYHVLY